MRIRFVTGKGGVGKSAIAAAMAFSEARSGKKTLLVELGNTSFFKDYFDLEQVSYKPVSLQQNLDVALWTGDECLKEYAQYLLKIESLYKLFFENPVTKSFIGIAPALQELALLGKITSHHRKIGPPLEYDCLVVDAYATGHFLALMKAPQGMSEAVSLGPMGEQSRSISKVIKDAAISDYTVVTIPEELPVEEGLELSEKMEAFLGIKPRIVLNKFHEISPAIFSEKVAGLENFQNYLGKMSEHQQHWQARLETTGLLKKLPFVFSLDPFEIVRGLSEVIE